MFGLLSSAALASRQAYWIVCGPIGLYRGKARAAPTTSHRSATEATARGRHGSAGDPAAHRPDHDRPAPGGPVGVTGRSLAPLLLDGERTSREFDDVYAERGFGGLTYGAHEHPPLHFPYEGRTFDELNTVTQSGRSRMLRRGDLKLVVHSDGSGELYDLAADPTEVHDLFDDPDHATDRADLLWRLTQWMLRAQDELPTGAYTAKRAPHNWVFDAGATDPDAGAARAHAR